ncbi:TPA: hypothetical protein U2I07_002599 [Citrobacter koseri]|uniref:Uncharacterized protein n=1 Tax=Citrobacter koseri TaxID=545 RepID=A0A447UVZ8_CITKO|nr:Uncharacterised protein [Citrobacter koseri]HEM6672535.1 hypothetical protein [Citrobacter koseri]
MKFIGTLCVIFTIGWAFITLTKNDKPLSVNEKLIAQFANQRLLKKDEWNTGNGVVDGVQVYTARKEYPAFASLWRLGVKDAGVTVLTSGTYPEFEPVLAMGQCKNLAIAVFDSDSKPVNDAVSTIFTTATETYKKEGKKVQATGDIGNLPFRVTVQNIDSVLTFSCDIDLSHYTSSI